MVMYKNNNKSVIKKLSIKTLLSNKKRNIITIFSIVLTCILLTSVITVTLSMVKSIEYTQSLKVGTNSRGGFKQLTVKEFDELKSHNYIKSYGHSIIVGSVSDLRLERRSIEIRTMNEEWMNSSFIAPLLQGHIPNSDNEILVDTIMLDLLNLPYEVEQEIMIEVNINDEFIKETFKIVGIYTSNVNIPASFMIVSEEYKDKQINQRKLNGEIGKNMLGANDMSITFKTNFNIEDQLLIMIEDSGNDINQINIGVNWAYNKDGYKIQFRDIIVYIIFIIFLMLSGYLIINNIYLIAITKDINYYGLLKTIGTTSKQISSIIYKQAIVLLAVSLPIGLSIGYILGIIILPFILDTVNVLGNQFSFSIWIFVLSANLTLITVLVSCRKPALIASKVTPLEAIKAVDTTYKPRYKKTKNGNRIYYIAWRNLFRVKKKAVLVILSLTLSLTVLNIAYMTVSSFDPNKFLTDLIATDYIIGDVEYFKYDYSDNDAIDKSLLKYFEKNKNISSYALYKKNGKVHLPQLIRDKLLDNIDNFDEWNSAHLLLKESMLNTDVYGVDEMLYELLIQHVIEGNPSIDKNQVIVDKRFFQSDGSGDVPYNIGDEIILEIDGNAEIYEISAFVDDLPLYLYDGNFLEYGISLYMSNGIFDENSVMSLMLNLDYDVLDSEINIDEILKKYPKLDFRSRENYIKDLENYILMLKIVGFSLSGLLGLIGILNFINMMITSIIVRKREFAMLQSIGMTSVQLKKMLFFEGGYIVNFSLLFAIVLNLIIGVIKFGTINIVNSFTILYVLPILVVLILILPLISYHYISKQSIVNRLNYLE